MNECGNFRKNCGRVKKTETIFKMISNFSCYRWLSCKSLKSRKVILRNIKPFSFLISGYYFFVSFISMISSETRRNLKLDWSVHESCLLHLNETTFLKTCSRSNNTPSWTFFSNLARPRLVRNLYRKLHCCRPFISGRRFLLTLRIRQQTQKIPSINTFAYPVNLVNLPYINC